MKKKVRIVRFLQWTGIAVLFVVLEHFFSFAGSFFSLIQFPLLLVFVFSFLGSRLSLAAIVLIGFASDLMIFYPDGLYVFALASVGVLYPLFAKIFHEGTAAMDIAYAVAGTILFFFVLALIRVFFLGFDLAFAQYMELAVYPSAIGAAVNLIAAVVLYAILFFLKDGPRISYRFRL